ncbi:DUF397 domain-containing protein [Streptomyces sp. NPDC050509]|uniref:DUF397 domain-containing protein n=1 Tax=Streptomyces sp. NPDC050509 TaxID=3365620 RepID=UPI00378FBCC9
MPTVAVADGLACVCWFKSSYCNDGNGDCVEGARLPAGAIAVRDSKNPHGPAFVFTGPAWAAFVGAVCARP